MTTDLNAQADSLQQQLSNLQPLADNGYIPRNRLLEYQRQLSQVQQELAQNTGESGRVEQGILESRLKLQQHGEEYQKEVRTQLADAQLKSVTLSEQLTSAGFDLQHSEIVATADGVAVNLGVHTEGAVVRQGEQRLGLSAESFEGVRAATVTTLDMGGAVSDLVAGLYGALGIAAAFAWAASIRSIRSRSSRSPAHASSR